MQISCVFEKIMDLIFPWYLHCNLVSLAYSTTDFIIGTLFCIQLWMKHWLLKCSAWNKLLVRPVILMCRTVHIIIWTARFSNSSCCSYSRSSHQRPSRLSSSSNRNQSSSRLSRSSGTIKEISQRACTCLKVIHTADSWRDTLCSRIFVFLRF